MAFNFDIKDPKNQKMLAVIMVPIVLLYGFFHFMIKPKIAELDVKKAEVATLNQTLMTTRKSLQSPAELSAQKESLEEKYAELEKFLPNEENVSLLLDQLTEVEHQSKVYLVGFNATQSVAGNGKPYKANMYRVTIQAGFHQFAEFMSKIMSLPRILSFSDLVISMNSEIISSEQVENEGMSDQPRSLSIECVLTSYIFDIAEVETPPEGK